MIDRRWDKSKPPLGAFTLNRGSDRAQGLIAWYPFGNSGGLFVPDFAGMNHQTFSGGRSELDSYGAPSLRLNGTSNYAFLTTPWMTTYPVTMSGWVLSTSFTAVNVVAGLSSHTAANPLMLLELNVTTGAGRWVARNDAGTVAAIATSNTATLGKDAFVIAASGSATDHAVSLNGGAVVTAATNVAAPFTFTRSTLGAGLLGSTTPSVFVVGRQAETCIWNVRKSNADLQLYADPAKRFELWYPLRSKRWISFPPAAAGGFFSRHYYDRLIGRPHV